uniref:Uncharacterized protein n=1 Tax=Anopheles merus TaxID=30066 RepID=A0A182VH16_ANOME
MFCYTLMDRLRGYSSLFGGWVGFGLARLPFGPTPVPPPGGIPLRGNGPIFPPMPRACMPPPFMLRRIGPSRPPWRSGGGIIRPIGGGIGRPAIGGIGGGSGRFISDIGPGGPPAPNLPFCGPRIRIPGPLRK